MMQLLRICILAAVFLGGSRTVNCTAEQACSSAGIQLSAASGTIRIPENTTTPVKYRSIRCKWTITVAENKVIDLKYLNFNLSGPCNNHDLRLYQGLNLQQVYKDDLCLSANNKDFITTSNVLKLEYYYYSGKPEEEFRQVEISWTTTDPVSFTPAPATVFNEEFTFTNTKGSFQSPGYSTAYSNNLDYHWTISATSDKLVSIYVESAYLEDMYDCRYDYMIVKDQDPGEQLVLCDVHQENYFFNGTTNVYFHSDESITAPGFSLTYQVLDSSYYACAGGTTLTAESGTLSNLDFTGSTGFGYQTSCLWIIEAAVDKVLSITFNSLDVFCGDENKFELSDGCNKCSYGLNYCGTTLPKSFITSNNKLYVTHLFYHYSKSPGTFEITWTAIDPPTPSTPPVPCTVFTSNDRFVPSPNFPNNYTNNMDVCWIITPAAGQGIQIFVAYQRTEETSGCQADFLQIYGGTDVANSQKYCGSKNSASISSSENITIWFHSDDSVTGGPFVWTYIRRGAVTPDLSCGPNTLTDTIGFISSPQFPDAYQSNANCEWTITAPSDKVISIEFMELLLPQNYPTQKCTDHVEIIDGNAGVGKIICKFSTDVIISENNIVKIKFSSDDHNEYQGVALFYNMIDPVNTTAVSCGEVQRGTYGNLETPVINEVYPNYLDCYWTIAPTKENVAIRLSNIYLEPANCTYDYIEVYPANETSGTRYCGAIHVPTLRFSKTDIIVHFHSDSFLGLIGVTGYWDATGAAFTSSESTTAASSTATTTTTTTTTPTTTTTTAATSPTTMTSTPTISTTTTPTTPTTSITSTIPAISTPSSTITATPVTGSSTTLATATTTKTVSVISVGGNSSTALSSTTTSTPTSSLSPTSANPSETATAPTSSLPPSSGNPPVTGGLLLSTTTSRASSSHMMNTFLSVKVPVFLIIFLNAQHLLAY